MFGELEVEARNYYVNRVDGVKYVLSDVLSVNTLSARAVSPGVVKI